MTKPRASELTPRQRIARNNKKRGSSTERALVRFLTSHGIPAKRVVLSGALKKYVKELVGNAENYRGDVVIETGSKPIRVEVKSRQKLPAYVVGFSRGKPWNVKEITHLCYLLTGEEFLRLCFDNVLPDERLKIGAEKCGALVKWFNQDESEIVAMKEYGKQKWYFAVKFKTALKIGGRYHDNNFI